MCFAGPGASASFGNRRRQGLRDAFARVVARAGNWPADALLIAGDLFENGRVTRDTLAFLRDQFASVPRVPIFIAPGNHDPYVPSSPYATEHWPDNVHVFTRPEWTSIAANDGQLIVHGFAFDGPDISRNPFGELRIDGTEGGVHVGVAHGSERAHQPKEKDAYAPFDAASAAARGLSYLALGHFHAHTSIEGPFETTIRYSGAPEGHSFKETGAHYFLEIEIVDHGVRVNPATASRFVYDVQALHCDGFNSSQDVLDAVRALKNPDFGAHVLRVLFTGVCSDDLRAEFGAIKDVLDQEFEWLEFADETRPTEDYEALSHEDSSVGAFAATLSAQIADATDPARREMLARAFEVGLAAFRRRELEVRGMVR